MAVPGSYRVERMCAGRLLVHPRGLRLEAACIGGRIDVLLREPRRPRLGSGDCRDAERCVCGQPRGGRGAAARVDDREWRAAARGLAADPGGALLQARHGGLRVTSGSRAFVARHVGLLGGQDMPMLGEGTRGHRWRLMRELMDRENVDALAFTTGAFFQFATNFSTDVRPWERPVVCGVPRS